VTENYFAPRNLVVIYRRFGVSCCFCLQCSLPPRSWTQHSSKQTAVRFYQATKCHMRKKIIIMNPHCHWPTWPSLSILQNCNTDSW